MCESVFGTIHSIFCFSRSDDGGRVQVRAASGDGADADPAARVPAAHRRGDDGALSHRRERPRQHVLEQGHPRRAARLHRQQHLHQGAGQSSTPPTVSTSKSRSVVYTANRINS